MEEKNDWRFAGNGYTAENGLDTADMETFKQDPIASLARETCQNSIDAKMEENTKVRIEFQLFELEKDRIPGYERLRGEIENCYEYKVEQNKMKDAEKLNKMIECIAKDTIDCLRISDFNTTGLFGEKFYLLTKGSAITDKVGTTGGSKGIGKFASFVASSFNTVFYSTLTKNNETKYLGISKLCSAPMDDTDEKTIGTGYFGINNKNEPVASQFNIDGNFNRSVPGTDVYILGFKKEEAWENKILSMILDSFLVAIYKDKLEVKIENIVINKDNLENIINGNCITNKNLAKSIKSQYDLISEVEGVHHKEFNIMDYGDIHVYVKGYNREEADMATNNCVMVRYPYMKIKSFSGISSIPCSVLCIIEDNPLNKLLKDIENPQHTDWFTNIDDVGLRKELKNIISQMKQTIGEYVIEVLTSNDVEKLDVEEAGDFLPENNDENSEILGGEQLDSVIKDIPKIVKKIKNKKYSRNPVVNADELSGIGPDIGGIEESDEDTDTDVNNGHNKSGGGQPHEGNENATTNDDEDNDILKHVPLTDIKKVFFVSNKNDGEYVTFINSSYEEYDCELEMKYYDDANNEYSAQISECKVENEPVEVKDGKAVHFKIKIGKNKIVVKTDLTDYYKCEVKLYANR